jgi:excisionase family DNA binding protein
MDENTIKTKRFSIGEASEYLSVSIDTLRRWEKKGRISALRSPGGHRYFLKKDLDDLFGKKYTRDEPTIRRSKDPDTFTVKNEIKSNTKPPYVSPFQQYAHDVPPPPPLAKPHPIPPQKPSALDKPEEITRPISPAKTKQPTIQKPAEKKIIPETQTPTSQIKEKDNSKLTERQTELLQGILKTDRKKRAWSSNIYYFIAALIIILAIVNAIVFYLWRTSPEIISPIP